MSHYKPYPAYRDSNVEWIGQVPEHWSTLRLANIGHLVKGNGGTKQDDAANGLCVGNQGIEDAIQKLERNPETDDLRKGRPRRHVVHIQQRPEEHQIQDGLEQHQQRERYGRENVGERVLGQALPEIGAGVRFIEIERQKTIIAWRLPMEQSGKPANASVYG